MQENHRKWAALTGLVMWNPFIIHLLFFSVHYVKVTLISLLIITEFLFPPKAKRSGVPFDVRTKLLKVTPFSLFSKFIDNFGK